MFYLPIPIKDKDKDSIIFYTQSHGTLNFDEK